MIAVGIIFWAFCSVMAYGITFAYFQGEWPTRAEKDHRLDRCISIVVGAFGPIGLVVAFINSHGAKYGVKF